MARPLIIRCCRRRLLCVLDQITFCKIAKVCNAHDRRMTGE